MTFQFVAIRPKKLQVEAILREVEAELYAEGREVKELYERTTKTWTKKPKFEILVHAGGREASVLVGTDDEKFQGVDLGTPPHVIRPKRKRRLWFRTGYRSKTIPRVLRSRASRRSGPWVPAKVVHHPGTTPRHITDTIQKMRKTPFKARMMAAVHRGAMNAF